MSVCVAEYCGQRTDVEELISPVEYNGNIPCPFMNGKCPKASRRNPLPPVCSVRKADGTVWIVCKDRLCATKKSIPLSDYQKNTLQMIASFVSDEDVPLPAIQVSRESRIPVVGSSNYSADYVMKVDDSYGPDGSPRKYILEMQGGGETSDTKHLTDHVRAWEAAPNRSNEQLRQYIQKTNTLETNAWRRQQEQFLVKGNVAVHTGGAIVFCVGSLLYDYLHGRIENGNLRNLRGYNWSLALLGIKEDQEADIAPGPLKLTIDEDKTLFTSYPSFLQILTNQGAPCPELFSEGFITLEE